MDLPVNGMWMHSKLPLQSHGVIEPVRTSPVACMVYMENQASALPHFRPNPEIAVKMKRYEWIIPEDTKGRLIGRKL